MIIGIWFVYVDETKQYEYDHSLPGHPALLLAHL